MRRAGTKALWSVTTKGKIIKVGGFQPVSRWYAHSETGATEAKPVTESGESETSYYKTQLKENKKVTKEKRDADDELERKESEEYDKLLEGSGSGKQNKSDKTKSNEKKKKNKDESGKQAKESAPMAGVFGGAM